MFAEARGLLDREGGQSHSSAPIALAAGAAYGHFWGTVQVMIGAGLGALNAFGLARVLGHDVLRRVFGDRVDTGLLGGSARAEPRCGHAHVPIGGARHG